MKRKSGRFPIWQVAVLGVLVAVVAVLGVMVFTWSPDKPPAATPVPTAAAEGMESPAPADLTPTPAVTPAPPAATPPVISATPEAEPTPEASPEATQEPTPEPTPSPTPTPTPTPSPTPTPTPTPTPAPTPTPEPPSTEARPAGNVLRGKIIGLDPGHQGKSNNEQEPVAPGSSETKKKVSSGTQGAYTRVPEHEVNLKVGLLLRDMLEDAGATVYMTRTSADVDVSNVERAQLFNKWNVDLGIRLHCNGSTDKSKKGAFMLVPADKNYPYYDENVKAAKAILAAYGEATGLSTERGITYRSDQTGFNWCERPIVNIEMGHMSYESDDRKITDSAFQKRMAQGIYNGIVDYFS